MAGPKRNHDNPPGDPRAEGEVTFNYSSHDGRFLLGTDPWMFETHWSSAGAHSAHLYNDPPGIRGVAIAEGASAIEQINADVIARSDFTSRTRTPQVGQCAVLENQNGFFVALQILSVGYSDLPSENIITLRYVIQTDGSADFSGHNLALKPESSGARALLRAAEEARMALSAVHGADTEAFVVPFGHNGPPPEYALSEVERSEAIAAVEVVAMEAVQSAPDLARLRSAATTIARAAKAVGLWIAGKTDAALDEFAKTIGKAAAVAAVGGFTAWVVLHGKLSVLAHLLSGFTG